ncbi:MAG: histidine phosphatase family protein [Myxococcota bacterium]|jgi:broad specificity phosphatase PhoE|nr:histidine phosphatase family protein [Myxococcota bacterium]
MEKPTAESADRSLCLVRHGQTDWNAEGRWQGHADPPLSRLGRAQAEALALALEADLDGARVGLLACSDLGRTRQTAAPLETKLGLVATLDPGLRELDIGEWSGLQREAIAARDPELLERFEAGDPDARPPGGESRREIRRRVRLSVGRLVDRAPPGRIVLVSHLGVIRALLPGAEPANADFIWLSPTDALTRRMLDAHPDSGSEGPL